MMRVFARTARLRVLGRRGVHQVELGSRIRLRHGAAWWAITLHRNGATHAPLPCGWHVEIGRRYVSPREMRRHGRQEMWIVVDAPAGVHLEVEALPGRRRS